jgi:hypothetical protein
LRRVHQSTKRTPDLKLFCTLPAIDSFNRNKELCTSLCKNGYPYFERYIAFWSVADEGTWAIALNDHPEPLTRYWTRQVRPKIEECERWWLGWANRGARRQRQRTTRTTSSEDEVSKSLFTTANVVKARQETSYAETNADADDGMVPVVKSPVQELEALYLGDHGRRRSIEDVVKTSHLVDDLPEEREARKTGYLAAVDNLIMIAELILVSRLDQPGNTPNARRISPTMLTIPACARDHRVCMNGGCVSSSFDRNTLSSVGHLSRPRPRPPRSTTFPSD